MEYLCFQIMTGHWPVHCTLSLMLHLQSVMGRIQVRNGSVVYGLCNHSIQWKELFAIYITCAVWVHLWSGKRLIFHTENSTDVAIWSSQSSKAHDLMDLARKIFLISAQHAFVVQFKHIPGINNPIADAFSRLQMERFRKLTPDANPEPTPVPDHLFQL